MEQSPKKFIELGSEKVKEIAGIRSVSTVTVYDALRFKTNNGNANIIRAWALENGGILFEEKTRKAAIRL